jgi:pimeloyl-ACP methyl ester carboxylesterase
MPDKTGIWGLHAQTATAQLRPVAEHREILHYDAFFRALDLQEFHLVGNSLGGGLAANLAIY